MAWLGVLLFGATVFAQQPTEQKKEPDRKEPQAPKADSLEDLIARALRDNPDIRVAEVKVREAEAELQRTRVATAQKVASLHASIEIARKARDEAEQRYLTASQLHRQGGAGVMSQEEMRGLKMAWERAIYEVAKLEGEMPGLLGKMPGKLSEDKRKAEAPAAATQKALQWLQHVVIDDVNPDDLAQFLDRREAAQGLFRLALTDAAKAAPKGTMAERIRKALDSPVNGDYKGKPFTDVFKDFEKHLDGIAFRVVQDPPKGKMDINLGQVPLGSAIQAVNDILADHRFVVRDYGILFTRKDWLPPGALLLHDFWKSDAGKDKQFKHDGATLTARGNIKAVDQASGLVTINVGSDYGITKDLTLHVYRLEPVPKYLGQIRIVEVRKDEAVGKPTQKLTEPLRPRDIVGVKVE
jgi:hypothetical protein